MVSLSTFGRLLRETPGAAAFSPWASGLSSMPAAYLETLKQFSPTLLRSLFICMTGHEHHLGRFQDPASNEPNQNPCVFGSGICIFKSVQIVQRCGQVWAFLPPYFGTSNLTTNTWRNFYFPGRCPTFQPVLFRSLQPPGPLSVITIALDSHADLCPESRNFDDQSTGRVIIMIREIHRERERERERKARATT